MNNDILIEALDNLRLRKRRATCALEDAKKELQEVNALINLVEKEIENNLKQQQHKALYKILCCVFYQVRQSSLPGYVGVNAPSTPHLSEG